MDFVYVGKIVNTHGLKGEVRVISNFKYKDEVFLPKNEVYINNIKYTISSHRNHKMYDLITFVDFNDIESVEPIKGLNLYIKLDEYKFSGYLDEELIGMSVYDKNTYKGKIIDIIDGKKYSLLVVSGNKRHMIPNINEFIENIDFENKKIYINYIKGLDCED